MDLDKTQGPNNKFLIFLTTEKFRHNVKIPPYFKQENLKPFNNKTFTALMHAEMQATADALAKKNRPNASLTIPSVTEENLASLLYLLEVQVALLGELYKINAFNQPGVELGKILTRKYIK